jgi:uncharacterized protein with von Willebrand factor type A (vWA) domain
MNDGPLDPPPDEVPEFVASADDVPDFVAARDHVVEELVRFVRALRRAGAEVPANAALTAARALVELGFERESAHVGLRAALVSRQEDLATFDRLFEEFWRRLTAGLDPEGPADRPGSDAPGGGMAPLGEAADPGERPDGDADPPEDREPDAVSVATRVGNEHDDALDGEDRVTTATYSPRGVRSPVDPDAGHGGDGDLDASVDRLTRALATLRGRRYGSAGNRRADARRALRESVGTAGTVLSVPRRDYERTAVRAAVLVDVSRSVLDVVDERFLVAFLRALRDCWRHVRVFLFDEDVREVSEELDAPTAAAAMDALERAETEWGGGTRIGHAIHAVRRDHPGAVDRDAVAFVVSDGLEVGELDRLESGMVWLSRRAAAVLWLNPLAAADEYEPSARGMATALPYVEGLFAFAGPEDVDELARQLRLRGPGGTVGHEQDPRRLGGS